MLGLARKSPVCSMTGPWGRRKRIMAAPGQLDKDILEERRQSTWTKGISFSISGSMDSMSWAQVHGGGIGEESCPGLQVHSPKKSWFQDRLAPQPSGQFLIDEKILAWTSSYVNYVICGKYFNNINSKKYQNLNWSWTKGILARLDNNFFFLLKNLTC